MPAQMLILLTATLLLAHSPPGAAEHSYRVGGVEHWDQWDVRQERVWRVGGGRHDWQRPWRSGARRWDHWYYGNRLPRPWVGYRDRWGWGSAYRRGLHIGVPLGAFIIGDDRRGLQRPRPLIRDAWNRRHHRDAQPRISACYRIERLPGGRERRIELPLAACRH